MNMKKIKFAYCLNCSKKFVQSSPNHFCCSRKCMHKNYYNRNRKARIKQSIEHRKSCQPCKEKASIQRLKHLSQCKKCQKTMKIYQLKHRERINMLNRVREYNKKYGTHWEYVGDFALKSGQKGEMFI